MVLLNKEKIIWGDGRGIIPSHLVNSFDHPLSMQFLSLFDLVTRGLINFDFGYLCTNNIKQWIRQN